QSRPKGRAGAVDPVDDAADRATDAYPRTFAGGSGGTVASGEPHGTSQFARQCEDFALGPFRLPYVAQGLCVFEHGTQLGDAKPVGALGLFVEHPASPIADRLTRGVSVRVCLSRR